METFRKSGERFGPEDNSHYYLATCHEINGNREPALCSYKEALILDPQCKLTHNAIRRAEVSIAEATNIGAEIAEFVYQI